MSDPLLRVRGLKTYFPVRSGPLRGKGEFLKAVDGVDLEIRRGETLGLVGESGCGKSTTGRSILRLIEPLEGEIHFDGTDVRALDRAGLRRFRRRAQIVFQDPYGSLNPRVSVGAMLEEVLRVHGLGGRDRRGRVARACWSASGCARSTSTGIRTSSAGANGSGWASPVRSPSSPSSWSSTSR